jgi:hypothetical protein
MLPNNLASSILSILFTLHNNLHAYFSLTKKKKKYEVEIHCVLLQNNVA